MKLKNKRTGEICELKVTVNGDLTVTKDDEIIGIYPSLAELNEEWGDYEEPKEYWFINEFGTPTKADFVGRETLYDKCRKNFGNYFDTREEAEKAVEKLKAAKRLKDKGFKLDAVVDTFFCIDIFYAGEAIKDDLKIVFGGEE